MPGQTAESSAPVGTARALGQVYRDFGAVDAAETSPLYRHIAVAVSESDEALRAIEVSDAFAQVPAEALPVVTTTWALSRFSPESRLRFLHRLDEAATDRTVAWVSVEGSESRRRYRRLVIAAHPATASSGWRCSMGRLCTLRPSAVAGRRAVSWRGWQTPSCALGAQGDLEGTT